MTGPTCDICGRPEPDQAHACAKCTDDVAVDLVRIVDLAPEVENAVAKLVRFGSGGKVSGERPLPFDETAAVRAAAIGNTLATWARHVSESLAIPIPRPPGEPGAVAAARYLHDRLKWLRNQREAAAAFWELRDAARELERLVGRPRDHWFAGACWSDLGEVDEAGQPLRCQQELYAPKGARVVRCRFCGEEHDAESRREWLLDQAREQLLHAEWVARALTGLGLEGVTGSRIRNLADRGRLASHGHDQAGRPLYQVGEVLDLLDEQARLEADRAAKREAKARARAERASRDAVA